ncbi:MAG: transcriptional repressor [Eubacteriales bacterium]|nr:transcriptional repressor [Eubacteriales bacterium]MDD3881173.1 transcriptional repressor [Eubacteriales bacterium]MDD4511555.1 transcriptional repressor [Eubacteriales bacterium]
MIIRKTIQCALVLETVKKLMCHPTADEVYNEIAKENPNISRTTVYRNLQRLCESGEIQKIEVPDAADRFDHTQSKHYHAKCLKCGKVSDVDMDYIPNVNEKIKNANGFKITGYEMIFKGVCPECQNTQPAK